MASLLDSSPLGPLEVDARLNKIWPYCTRLSEAISFLINTPASCQDNKEKKLDEQEKRNGETMKKNVFLTEENFKSDLTHLKMNKVNRR